MPLYLPKDGPRIFFAHVPKTAGSSIKTYLNDRYGLPSLSDRSIHGHNKGYRQRGFVMRPSHFSAEDLLEFIPEHVDFLFAFVRDPMKRLLSEYGYQQGKSFASKQPFSTWLRIVFKAAEIDRRVYRNHIRPQTEMVPEGTEVFKLEDGFADFIARLDEVSGGTVDYGIEHVNKSKVEKKKAEVRQQDVELIRSFYAPDYERFGYDMPEPGSYPADPQAALRSMMGAVLAPRLIAKQRADWLR